MLSARYYRNKGDIDTNFIRRPQTKWTITTRANLSGTRIEAEGVVESGEHFKSQMTADMKSTLSLGVSYLGLSLNLSLNPSKMMGKYHDYELNFHSYGKRFGFDFIFQEAKNFTGWHDQDGMARIDLPADMLNIKTLNINAHYVVNSRRFSYPPAFSQNYIQLQSAGSLLLGLSFQGQKAELEGEHKSRLTMTNIGIGAGYGYNYVPGKGWLVHISVLPTFIVRSITSMTFDDNRVPLDYHFPEVIITSRYAMVYQWSNKFAGFSTVYNFTNIGNKERLSVHNQKWRIQAFLGLRL